MGKKVLAEGKPDWGSALKGGNKQEILTIVILKSSKYKTILISRTCPYLWDLPLQRFHGCLQAYMLFGKAKAKEMKSLEGGSREAPRQKKKSYLDSAIALRQMTVHVAAPNRWVENLRLY